MTDPLHASTSITPLKHTFRALCVISIAAPSLALAQTAPVQTAPSRNVPVSKQTTEKSVLTGKEIKDIMTRAIEQQKRHGSLTGKLSLEITVNANMTYSTTAILQPDPKTGPNPLIYATTTSSKGVLLQSMAGSLGHDTDTKTYETMIDLYGPDGKTILAEEISSGDIEGAQQGEKRPKTISFTPLSKECPSALLTFSYKGDDPSRSISCTKNDGTSVSVDIPSETDPAFTVSYKDAHQTLLKTIFYEPDPASPDKTHPAYRLATRDEKTHQTDTKPAPSPLSATSYLPAGVPINAEEATQLLEKTYNSMLAQVPPSGGTKPKQGSHP